MRRLPLSFFNRPTITVAQELLGKEIFSKAKKPSLPKRKPISGKTIPPAMPRAGKQNAPPSCTAGPGFLMFI